MTPKQKLFIAAYQKHANAMRAAREAGYKHPKQNGNKLLHNPEIKAACESGIQARMKAHEVSADQVVERIRTVAFGKSEETRDVLKACELLGKYLGLFKDRVQLETVGQVVIEIPSNGREAPIEPKEQA
jgi:phage terminase small subunit